MRPDFLFIGPDKTGSSWLHAVLRQHPDCFVPAAKDIYFFDRYYDRGLDWYLRHFRDAPAAARAVGELSHDYLFSAEAAARIRHDLPQARLLTSLRHPVERSFSQYLFMLRNGITTVPFEQAIEEIPAILDNSRYARHLSGYYALFPRAQIKVLFFDKLQADPDGFARETFDFLGLSMIEGLDYRQQVLPASRARNRWIAHLTHVLAWRARDLGLGALVGKVKQSWVRDLLFRPYAAAERPRLAAATRARLTDRFAADVCRLEELVGVDLAHWKRQNGAVGRP